MNKLLSVILLSSLCFLFPNMESFASAEGTSIIFSTDFESEIDEVGSKPRSIPLYNKDAAIVCTAGNNNGENGNTTKHIKLDKRVTPNFNKVSISSGVFYIDFDAMATKGYMSVGLINSSSASGKWIFGMPDVGETEYGAWQAYGGIPPGDPSETFKKKGTNETFSFFENTWNSYRLKVDVDNSAVTLFIDGVESDVISGYTYFGGANEGITGVVFRNDYSKNNNVYIDNIKIHWAEATVSNVALKKYDGTYNDDFSDVSVMTECMEIKITCPMESSSLYNSISLHNSTSGEDEVLIQLTMDEENRLLYVYFEKPLSPKSNYSFKITTNAKDIYGRNFYEDYILAFTTCEDENGFDITEMHILKDGNPVTLSDLSVGDTITLMAKYFQVGDVSVSPKLIFAYSAEKDLTICDFNFFQVECSEVGLKTVEKEITIKPEIEPDTIYFYIWDITSLAPVSECITLN